MFPSQLRSAPENKQYHFYITQKPITPFHDYLINRLQKGVDL